MKHKSEKLYATYQEFIIIGLPLLIFGMLILKRKRWAWYAGEILLLLFSLSLIIPALLFFGQLWSLPYVLQFVFFASIPPFILLLDRKNFFKVAK